MDSSVRDAARAYYLAIEAIFEFSFTSEKTRLRLQEVVLKKFEKKSPVCSLKRRPAVDRFRRLRTELEQTKALLALPRIQGNVRLVLENLKADLEKEILALDSDASLARKIS